MRQKTRSKSNKSDASETALDNAVKPLLQNNHPQWMAAEHCFRLAHHGIKPAQQLVFGDWATLRKLSGAIPHVCRTAQVNRLRVRSAGTSLGSRDGGPV